MIIFHVKHLVQKGVARTRVICVNYLQACVLMTDVAVWLSATGVTLTC